MIDEGKFRGRNSEVCTNPASLREGGGPRKRWKESAQLRIFCNLYPVIYQIIIMPSSVKPKNRRVFPRIRRASNQQILRLIYQFQASPPMKLFLLHPRYDFCRTEIANIRLRREQYTLSDRCHSKYGNMLCTLYSVRRETETSF